MIIHKTYLEWEECQILFPTEYGVSSLEVRSFFPRSTEILPLQYGLFPTEYGVSSLEVRSFFPRSTVGIYVEMFLVRAGTNQSGK